MLAANACNEYTLYICDKCSILNKGTKSKFAHITPNNNKNTPLQLNFIFHFPFHPLWASCERSDGQNTYHS